MIRSIKHKITRRLFLYIVLVISIIFSVREIVFSAENSTIVGNFDSSGNKSDGTGSFADAYCTITGADNSSTYTAEASARSRPLSDVVGLTFAYGGNGDDWSSGVGGQNYENKYLGLYIYNANSSAQTLTITITEYDEDPACQHPPIEACREPVAETWTANVTISWTNSWGYAIKQIKKDSDGGDFTASGGDGTLNTTNSSKTNDNVKTIKGVTEFKLSQNANLYIDHVVICNGQSDASVDGKKMFPNLVSSTTVSLDNMVPTFSTGLIGSSDTPKDDDSHIYIVTAAAQNTPLGTSTYSSSADNTVYLTPTSSLSAGTPYIMFVRPVDTNGDVAECQVYNFTLNLGYTYSAPSISFQRELTN